MSNNENDEARWWEGPEGHRFALEVLQLGLRRRMLGTIAAGAKNIEEIKEELCLSSSQAQYHLSMLEKALVIERTKEGWMATPIGLLFLDKVKGGA
jgi:predicted transcriptional regulator